MIGHCLFVEHVSYMWLALCGRIVFGLGYNRYYVTLLQIPILKPKAGM